MTEQKIGRIYIGHVVPREKVWVCTNKTSLIIKGPLGMFDNHGYVDYGNSNNSITAWPAKIR